MEFVLRSINSICRASVTPTDLTLTEVIRLTPATRPSKVVPREFPVYLIHVVGHHDCCSNDTCTRGDLELDLDATKMNIEARPDVGSIISLGEGEVGTVWSTVIDSGIVGEDPVRRSCGLFGEVHEIVVLV